MFEHGLGDCIVGAEDHFFASFATKALTLVFKEEWIDSYSFGKRQLHFLFDVLIRLPNSSREPQAFDSSMKGVERTGWLRLKDLTDDSTRPDCLLSVCWKGRQLDRAESWLKSPKENGGQIDLAQLSDSLENHPNNVLTRQYHAKNARFT